MNSIQTIRFLVLVSMLVAGALQAGSTNLLPGVTFYDGPEKLTGKLVFYIQHDYPTEEFAVVTNTPTAASIFEYDLQQKYCRKLTDCPIGSFTSARDGCTICVVYQLGEWRQNGDKNVFIWSNTSVTNQTLRLNSPPGKMVVLAGHIFFELGTVFHNELFDYEIAKGSMRQIKLPDASEWEIQTYDKIYAPIGQTNLLFFHYNGIGKRLAEGKDYPEGVFSLNINTGNIRPSSDEPPSIDRTDEKFYSKTFEGNFIVFSDGDEAPVRGFKLVSTSWNNVRANDSTLGDKEKTIKVLHEFSKLSSFVHDSGPYILTQMSPDLHYAWVASGESSGGTYYLVDVITGKTREMLKIASPSKAHGDVLDVRWVQ